jgi:hypothetical protein
MKSMMLVMTVLFLCSVVYSGSYIKDYSSGKRLYEFDGKYVKSYSSGKRLMESTGVIPRVIVALIVLQGL